MSLICLTYIVDCLRLVSDLSIATLSECLVHLGTSSGTLTLHWLSNWVYWLLDLGIAKCVPVLASAPVSILAALVLQLVLILIDGHLLLVRYLLLLLIPYMVLWVADYNWKEKRMREWHHRLLMLPYETKNTIRGVLSASIGFIWWRCCHAFSSLWAFLCQREIIHLLFRCLRTWAGLIPDLLRPELFIL